MAELWTTLAKFWLWSTFLFLCSSATQHGRKPTCVFPFTYENRKYFCCTNEGMEDGRFWCATTENYNRDKSWMYCPETGKIWALLLHDWIEQLSGLMKLGKVSDALILVFWMETSQRLYQLFIGFSVYYFDVIRVGGRNMCYPSLYAWIPSQQLNEAESCT